MEITKNSIIGDVLDQHPETAQIFLSIGMHCLGCPLQEARQLRKPAWFTAQTPTRLLRQLTRLLNDNP